MWVSIRFAVIVGSTKVHSDRFTFGWHFFVSTKQKSSQTAYPQYTDLLVIVLPLFSFLRSYVYASHEWVCVCVCHRWLHLNWIKSTIWKSSDSCCMIWGGIPLSSFFLLMLLHCNGADTDAIYSFASYARRTFHLPMNEPPEITFTLFYLWRSRVFFSLFIQWCWCWCWRRCCCYHYLWFFAAPFFIPCSHFVAVPPSIHQHNWLFPSLVRVLFVSFFRFSSFSFVQCTV